MTTDTHHTAPTTTDDSTKETTDPTPWTHRGEHPMPHQSRTLQRDLVAEKLRRHPGGTAPGWRLTARQVEDRRTGAARGMPYEFLIYDPASSAHNWTAFYTRTDLDNWLTAYAMTLETDPEPGQPFRILLPESEEHWQPLHARPTP